MKTILGIKGLALTEYAIAANADLGIRDSGKTYTATKAAEELYDAGVPWVALDPIGVWHSLRIPGRGKGYPVVVAGGRHADLPLIIPGKGASPAKNVGEIVRAAMQSGVSLVIDLFSIELSKADWKRIVRETVEILMHENADYGQRHVFIEEAAEFVPQRMNGADGQVFAAVEKLVRMGGNSKLGCTLINQRSADLNKSVLELCANVFVHRQTGKNTLMDLHKWFDVMGVDKPMRDNIAATLPILKSGECWVLSTELPKPVRLKVPAKNSLHPDRRAASVLTAMPVRAKSSDTFIAEMKAKLAEKPKAAKPVLTSAPTLVAEKNTADLQQAVSVAYWQGRAEVTREFERPIKIILEAAIGAKAYADRMDAVIREQLPILDKLRAAGTTAKQAATSPRSPSNSPSKGPISPSSTLKAPTKPRAAASAPPDGISKPQAKILESLAWWAAMGHARPTRVQVGIKAKMKARGGHFKTRVSELSGMGLVAYDGADKMYLTDRGAIDAPVPEMGETVLASLRPLLSNPQGKILEAMVQGFTDRGAIAEAASMDAAGGHFKTRLSELSSFGIIDYPDKSSAVLQPWILG